MCKLFTFKKDKPKLSTNKLNDIYTLVTFACLKVTKYEALTLVFGSTFIVVTFIFFK